MSYDAYERVCRNFKVEKITEEHAKNIHNRDTATSEQGYLAWDRMAEITAKEIERRANDQA